MTTRLPHFLLLFISALGFIISPEASAQNVPELMYYKFDSPGSTVQNSASTPVGTNPATISGATIASPGQFGSALAGNGGASGSNAVNTGWNPNLTGPWTMSMWFSGITNTLSSNYFFGSSSGTTFRALTGTGVVAGGGNLEIRSTGMTDVFANNVFDATGTPVVIHFVYNPTVPDIKVYVNGVFNNAVAQPANLSINGTTPFLVGGYGTNNGLPSGGKLDEFRLYNRALTAAEIASTWNQTLPLVVSPNDAGVSAITGPVSPTTPGNQNIQVKIKNYGSGPLTSTQVNWKVGNTTGTPFSWSGNLASLAESNPVNIGTFNFPNGTHTLKAWTQNPNGATDGNAYNDTTYTTIIACNALSGTYTINKNAPATATNFTSFASAIQILNTCGITGAVTFNVVAGSGPYTEQIVLNSINGQNATNTITFNGNGNTITVNPGATNLGIITLNGTDYTRFNGFILNLDASATMGWGVQLMNAANNNTISNCTINLPPASTSSNINGIGWGTTISTTGNHASNTLIQNNVINGGYYGIRLNGSTGGADALNNQIINNQIRDTYIYSIYLNNTDGTVIERNNISRPTRSSVSTFYGLFTTGTTKNALIAKNRFHNAFGANPTTTNAAYVIYFSSTDAPAGSENIVKNNLIYNINTNGTIYAIYNIGSDGVYVFNNTIDLNNPTNSGTVRAFYQSTAATNLKFNNNIISMGGASGSKHGIYLGTTTTAIVSNYNVFNMTMGSVGFHSTDRPTLANWRTANGGIYDQNSVAADPVFVNPAAGNYRPSSVAVENMGTPLAAVTDDITGAARGPIPDPGAYEFSVFPNDVGVSFISGPPSGCGLTASETITLTIKNYGTLTQTTIPVSLVVNGNPAATATWTGTLGPNATAAFTFPTSVNLAAAGTYQIIGKTLANDANPSNDADTIYITNSLLPQGPVNLNFETPTTGTNAMRSVTNAHSTITESTNAATGAGSTKGMIMAGVNNAGWVVPVGITDPWLNNPTHFSAVYLCYTPHTGGPNDTLRLSFDLKQLYKTTHYNTNFRVTVNGKQEGPTYNPPFGGYGGGAAPWTHVEVDLSKYLNSLTIEIGLESSVSEEYNNGNGTANLIDNIEVERIAGRMGGIGISENILQSNLVVFPNPSNGLFNLKVPATTRNYSVEVMDLTGKLVKQQTVTNNAGTSQLNLNGTAKGIYILKIASEGNVATRKLIVE
ncbi:T9SS type A sorting domain-containing protein [Adhaeribacter sp. BT258]|uniref:T9SS type A sorting domain-containing protein n=1 Tax=Adhaeribacter terrigena TaxID=2793070 RepID=A0ABS1C4R2_9BACT|nr:T9SS type A sorting domain-containing protein [Adhaeribacter terrigena]MBK0404381.1 T9SS type A sorting domain-containing protein [Adhaeribacter terrigena]